MSIDNHLLAIKSLLYDGCDSIIKVYLHAYFSFPCVFKNVIIPYHIKKPQSNETERSLKILEVFLRNLIKNIITKQKIIKKKINQPIFLPCFRLKENIKRFGKLTQHSFLLTALKSSAKKTKSIAI